ncbi:hypothetical protein HPP92_008697 [Vanilla planifolia]|uniref:Homeobox-leucine zipper protein n=1 Tax=Vanilla planifolia TaxID=51239 RepID=A0A835RI89_VANPL|nr:hypothetical protein HPP92_008697 [Vanilla planifolia]
MLGLSRKDELKILRQLGFHGHINRQRLLGNGKKRKRGRRGQRRPTLPRHPFSLYHSHHAIHVSPPHIQTLGLYLLCGRARRASLTDLMLPECWRPEMQNSETGSGVSRGGCEVDAAEKRKRFSEEQVKSLETMFEEQAKLEPKKKQQLARELGLQPRQVAIWFQNKRARWKSKQLERAYAALRADYDALRSSFDSLRLQRNLLATQVQTLTERMEENAESCKQSDAVPSPSFKRGETREEEKMLIAKSSSEAGECREEKEQPFFQSGGWTSEQLSAGNGGSQWWEFLTYD